jgi:hypothetical protein
MDKAEDKKVSIYRMEERPLYLKDTLADTTVVAYRL